MIVANIILILIFITIIFFSLAVIDKLQEINERVHGIEFRPDPPKDDDPTYGMQKEIKDTIESAEIELVSINDKLSHINKSIESKLEDILSTLSAIESNTYT